MRLYITSHFFSPILTFLLFCMASGTALGRPTILLDPGHGGSNLGAYGPSIRQYEKKLNLELALQVKGHLQSMMPSAKVFLTRASDVYLSLQQRVAIANELKVDMFVSIHLNASENRSQHGFETYILSLGATDKEAARLAMSENHEAPIDFTAKTGISTPKDSKKEALRVGILGNIVRDLELSATHADSRRFAQTIQLGLRSFWGKEKDRGVRQAGFDVLRGIMMPGVLVEVGFIDHPMESLTFSNLESMTALSQSLADGILQFWRESQ